MKIIFLDIDGVLKEDRQGAPFLGESFSLLKTLVDRTGAKLVMSSSWKVKYKAFVDNGFKTDIEDIKKLYAVLTEYGLSIFDYTPYLNIEKAIRRPTEIREYLAAAKDVEGFCILDDRDEFDWAELRGNLVLTFLGKNADGEKQAHLTEEHILKAEKILNI